MPSPATTALLHALPWALRLDIEGYLASVTAASNDIYEEANVERDAVTLDDLLLVAAAWRIWTKIDAQHWIVQNTLTLSQAHGVSSIRTGATTYSQGSEEVIDLGNFRMEMREWLRRNDLQFVLQARGIVPLLQMLAVLGTNGN